MPMLAQEEYVEQAYLFRVLHERLGEGIPMQDLLGKTKQELLASASLPIAVDFLATELKHSGMMAPAMQRMGHYFTPFQSYVIGEAEYDRGHFQMQTAVRVLQLDAEFRSKSPNPQGCFLYQFETLCRNRMRYDLGLEAVSQDPIYDANWRAWIIQVRHQLGLVDLANLIYLRSEDYLQGKRRQLGDDFEPTEPVLFGMKEGRIAMANCNKDPLFLFAAMQRHLGYPAVPKPAPIDESKDMLPQLMRRMERLETRVKILSDEQRQGLDITNFYVDPNKPPTTDS